MKYDIIIVGSGPGGYVAAIRAAQLGKKVALVERSEPGGVCLNWGCIPTKALLKSAQVYTYCKSAEHYGISLTGEVHPNLEKIVARSRGVAETMSKGVAFLLKKNNIDLIQGFGRLTAAGRLDVGGTHYEADHIILATGARPREMAFMPVDGEHVISSRQALTLTRLPETMVVVGSGAIGSEFAWFYAALGVKVTVVEYMPRMMPLEDEEVSKAMERAFRKLRAAVMTSTTVKSVRVNAEGRCEVEIEGIPASFNLIFSKDACTGCHNTVISSLMDMKAQDLFPYLENMNVCVGPVTEDMLPADANADNTVCIGVCCKKLADAKGFRWVVGCPPGNADVVKGILGDRKEYGVRYE